MMVVLVLIGLIAGTVTVGVRGYLVKGRQSAAKAELAAIRDAVNTYFAHTAAYPSNEQGLAVLQQPGSQFPEPLLEGDLLDPWNRPYQYNSPGRNNKPYEVICFGADGREGGQGADADLSCWALSGSNGPAP
jgi:general secretion pathway protein G